MRWSSPPVRLRRGAAACVLLAASSLGCVTMLGPADRALARGDYREAADLYAEALAREPDHPAARAKLTRVERALLDRALDRVDAARRAGDEAGALRAGLHAMEERDRVSHEALDPPRRERVAALVAWARATVRASVVTETAAGRALAARAARQSQPWLARPELADLGPELDAEIASAGARTCERATGAAADEPFTVELVAAYCKAVGAPLPPWQARPMLVGGALIEGGVAGTPEEERAELEAAVTSALERSVWFTPVSSLRAAVRLDGSVSAELHEHATELARSWTERVPYEANEPFTEAIEVPYVETETYTERVPFTEYEDRVVRCVPPRPGLCKVSRPVTRWRDETRERKVKRIRTEHRERTRSVTRYRDEPRVFRFPARKHEGRYEAVLEARAVVGPHARPIDARVTAEDSRVAYEHDAEFAPAGVRPERGTLPTASTWRREQRARLGEELARALDAAWVSAFCSEAVESVEEAARCARARPAEVPAAVLAKIEELFGDDPALVLELPRPGEAVD